MTEIINLSATDRVADSFLYALLKTYRISKTKHWIRANEGVDERKNEQTYFFRLRFWRSDQGQ